MERNRMQLKGHWFETKCNQWNVGVSSENDVKFVPWIIEYFDIIDKPRAMYHWEYDDIRITDPNDARSPVILMMKRDRVWFLKLIIMSCYFIKIDKIDYPLTSCIYSVVEVSDRTSQQLYLKMDKGLQQTYLVKLASP
uniref:Uncharacterized protein n=1 Tax=Romanomermis culicivorax TaxID=13658 RepID=A0A915KLV2_ROMCU